jgi:hypothetical protein
MNTKTIHSIFFQKHQKAVQNLREISNTEEGRDQRRWRYLIEAVEKNSPSNNQRGRKKGPKYDSVASPSP